MKTSIQKLNQRGHHKISLLRIFTTIYSPTFKSKYVKTNMTYSTPHKILTPYHSYHQSFYQQFINNEAYQESTISLHASHSSTMPRTITSQPCIELYKRHHKSERITEYLIETVLLKAKHLLRPSTIQVFLQQK